MNQTRTFLIVIWLMLAYLCWQAWQLDHAPQLPIEPPSSAQASTPSIRALTPAVPAAAPVPVATSPGGRATGALVSSGPTAGPSIILANDVLRLHIGLVGAGVDGAELLAYGQTEARLSPPVRLLDPDLSDLFLAQSGLLSAGGHAPTHLSVFHADGPASSHGDAVSQSFLWSDGSGVQVRRTYTLRRGSYAIDVRDQINNGATVPWVGSDYRQLMRVPPVIKKTGGIGMSNPAASAFVGAAWYSPEEKYQTRPFSKYEPVDQTVTGGWVAMVEHYFLAAWIPDPKEPMRLSTVTDTINGVSVYRIDSEGPVVQIPAGGSREIDARLYVGPSLQDTLPAIAPGLERTVDYGWFVLFAGPLYWLLSKLHWMLGNWGWSIVALVLAIKLVMFKLSESQYKSMAKMRALQPRLEALKERYGDDKQQYQMAMMEFYKKEKVNPAGGCAPLLVQIPVFFALYRVLLYSVELRHAPWFGWIHSLSDPDPYFVLPALYMLVMFVTQRLTPTPGMDPMQKKMMQYMPLVFGFMFLFFPSGLVLYWVVNGSLGLLQQWWLMRKHGAPGALVRKA